MEGAIDNLILLEKSNIFFLIEFFFLKIIIINPINIME